LFVCSSSSSGEATIQIATVAEAGDEGIRVKKNLRVPAEFSKNSTGATKGLRGEERRKRSFSYLLFTLKLIILPR